MQDNDNIKKLLEKAKETSTKNPIQELINKGQGLKVLDFVTKWAKDNKFSYDNRGRFILNNQPTDFKNLYNKILLYYEDNRKVANLPVWNLSVLKAAIEEHQSNLKREKINEITDSLKYRTYKIERGEEELVKYVKACKKEATELDIAVHKQVLRNILRNANDIPTDYELFLIYKGKQGGGKTQAIRKLAAPLEFLFKAVSFAQLEDKFAGQLFAESLLIFIDELDKAEKTSIELIKNMVTSADFTAREMYSSTQTTYSSRATFIGATNKPIEEILNDPTGMRRFYQFNCDDKMDWETINQIDFFKIYRSINVKEDAYTLPFADELRKHQEMLRKNSIYEIFLEEKEITSGTLIIPAAKFYEVFKEWCEYNHIKPCTHNYFSREMNKLGIEKFFDGKTRSWKLNRDPMFRESLIDNKLKAIQGGKNEQV